VQVVVETEDNPVALIGGLHLIGGLVFQDFASVSILLNASLYLWSQDHIDPV
jgi:hypothetical protein